ncbi:CHY zinc finger-domain-containing protein [Daedaleopsis nitida]|nr:CHY zinc finger-domain-containing protein [Daedaleopsis nitida]
MCKHILNAQVAIRAPCCKQWFDCAECHAETQSHRLAKTNEMAFLCKKCKKAFRKDMSEYDESDEYCPHCDNHYVSQALHSMWTGVGEPWTDQVIEAKSPQAVLGVEGEDPRLDARMLKDERAKQDPTRSLFAAEFSDRLG